MVAQGPTEMGEAVLHFSLLGKTSSLMLDCRLHILKLLSAYPVEAAVATETEQVLGDVRAM